MQTAQAKIRASLYVGGAMLLVVTGGCFAPWFRSPKDGQQVLDTRREAIREKLESEERPRIISQIASERMLTLSRLENVALVTMLPDTGGPVKASQPREKMLDIMRRNDADQPNALLDAKSTAMVVAYANVPPAAKKGTVMDVTVKLSSHAEAKNLQSGWLIESSLMEMSKLGGQIREGFAFATAQGPLVTRAQAFGGTQLDDQLEATVVGGARLLKSRELGIGINQDFADAITMAAIVPAINARFTVFDGRKQVGIATPTKDSYIGLEVPPNYALDPFHFINVVLQISFNETEAQQAARMEMLRKQLEEPITVRAACWQLEAIGAKAIPLLASQLDNPNPEIRFYTAHSLAYLNDKRAIEPLAALARQEPAFRAMCLNALSVIDSYEAADALEKLLHTADAETRYGAVRALRHRDRSDPRIASQRIDEVGGIIEIPSAGPPLVAVSLHERPEVVIFGSNPRLALPAFHYVNPRIILQPAANNMVMLSHFAPGQDDRTAQVDNDLRSVLSGIADVGGSYGDWVSFLREASERGFLVEPLAMNPIPTAGRVYNRTRNDDREPGEHLYEKTLINALDTQAAPASSKRTWYNPFGW